MKIEKGAKESYAPRVTPGPAMLVEAVMSEIEGRLAGSAPPAEVAERLVVKLSTPKAMREARIPPAKKNLAMTAQAIKKLVGDKVDDSDPKVIPAGRRHAGDRIASRANRKKRMRHDNETYSGRNIVARCW